MTNDTDPDPPKKKEYLIVDDEPDICWALNNILKSRGLNTRIAHSAREAIAMIQPDRFELAFLDVTLPDMNGFDLARHLRRMDPKIRLVIVSGLLSADSKILAWARDTQPFYGCVIKPFLHSDILCLINRDSRVSISATEMILC